MNNKTKTLFDYLPKNDKLNNQELIEEIVACTKMYCVDNGIDSLSISLLITDDLKYELLPFPSSVLNGPMGDMLINTFIKNYPKENNSKNIINILDFNFGLGFCRKKEDISTEEFKSLVDKCNKKILNKEIQSDDYIDEYFIVNNYSSENINTKIYDVIKVVDQETEKKYLVLSPEEVNEINSSYDKLNKQNFFDTETVKEF